jgi:regulator of sirC expression with transglutaminase-like and TPR domain
MPDVAIDNRELEALVSLLETESSEHLTLLVDQMRAFPDESLRRLGAFLLDGSAGDAYLNLVLAERDATKIAGSLSEWIATGANLEDGVLLIARSGYPRLAAGTIRDRLDAIADEIGAGLPAEGGVRAIRHVASALRDTYRFHGNETDYYDPDNSYLNRVLATRSGLPISLSVLWILLGTRLDLPISGVSLPSHFIASLPTAGGTIYFNPFRDGEIMNIRDIMNLVSATGRIFHPNHLRPATSLQIVQRMFNNLLHGYQIREDVERVRLVRQYLAAL